MSAVHPVFDPFLPTQRPAGSGAVDSPCSPAGVPVKVTHDGVAYHYESSCQTAGAATLEALDLFGPQARIVVDGRGVNRD